MTTERDFDRIAATWLAGGPDELPERVLDAVAGEIHHTRQRHGLALPRRFPPMSLSARGAAILVVAALMGVAGFAVIGGAGGRPAPSPSPSASAAVVAPVASPVALPPLTQSFDSPRSGYSVGHPAGWAEHGARYSWLPGTDDWYGSAALDVLQGPDARFVGASQPLLAQSSDDWLVADCLSFSAASQCADVPAARPKITAGRITGYLLTDGDPAAGVPPSPNGKLYRAVFFFGSNVYDFRLDGNVDRPMFQAILDTVRFTPEEVVSLPTLTATFHSPTYGYSVGMADDWTVAPATRPWKDLGNSSEFMDGFALSAATDMGVMSQPLGSRTFGDFVDAFYAGQHDAVGSSCDGGEPSTWPEIAIGDQTGRVEVQCGSAEALVAVGGRMYLFELGLAGQASGDAFTFAAWKELLLSVTFDPTSAAK